MTDQSALDLSTIDPAKWRIMVNDVVYGPYTFGQMKTFHDEQRLSETSMVAEGDGGAFLPAFEQPGLRSVFEIPDEHEPEQAPAPQVAALPAGANYLLTLQGTSTARQNVIDVLNVSGLFAELMPGCFILNSGLSLFELRQQLGEAVDEKSRFVLTNASSGQLAWTGLQADADQHVKAVWKPKS